MSALLGLALLAGPFTTLPPPAHVGDPALVALGSDPARLRLFCWSTRCGDAEWRQALAPASGLFNGGRQRAPALPGSEPWIGLHAPARPRTSAASYANDWRIGARYGLQAIDNGPTRLGVQLGAGYRLATLRDDGIALPGPVLRGSLEIAHELGDRAHWNQRIQFETGHGMTFVKQSLGLDVVLWPSWTLESDLLIRHDEFGPSGSESAESSLRLRRRF
ncbi:DUF481 domain-containing protein [Novilysobacter luteus]|uniref:DUF481 domain-containing protein n=1 Tax=Novilysobacter luteus TaxID=2822368 RepID=A0ABM8UI43_9GAMM|nr:DUF481 domain-containing protein [Lysobacter luteus]CAG4977559.1 hypothetical protein LYB30171_02432 [Lysobacter luteus]